MTLDTNNPAHPQSRLLGIDYGSRRVGVAVSDPGKKFALPVSVIENTPELVKKITKLAKDNEVREIVLGESLDYEGKPNSIYLDASEFKADIEREGFMVHFEPEFMTSIQAERLQGKNDKSDASAAALILQSFLDRRNSENR